MNNIYFVSGIDTNIGKSYATGFIAKQWNKQGINTITQKLIQTGNKGYSEDIDIHRKIMGIAHTKEDKTFLTMPEIFSYPASPHLAAKIENREIDFNKIELATKILSKKYDRVLMEGAGGLMVPLKSDYLTIDYLEEKNYPIILVSSGKLGSINHTLLSLELIKSRKLQLHTLAYNLYPENDNIITKDSEQFIKNYLEKHFPNTTFVSIPIIK